MTDSTQQVPSFSRVVAELDGTYPGLSLYEIVTQRTRWKPSAKKRWKDKDYDHLLFEGEGDGFRMSYHAAQWRVGKAYLAGFDFHRISNIRLIHRADRHREYPSTTIEVENCLENFGSSEVRIIASHGPDFNIPVWGLHSERTWQGSRLYLSQCLDEWRQTGNFDPLALTKMQGGKMFLARLALEFGTSWGIDHLDPTLPVEAISADFAQVIDRGRSS